MSWLDGTDDDSRRRRENNEHAEGHSSMSKTPISTSMDEIGGITTPSRGKLNYKPNSLSSMGGLSAVGDKASEWIEFEITVDSGACEIVMPMGACHSISVMASKQYMDGVEYEVANGETIPNLGERRCIMMTVGSNTAKKITFQVADVHKPLLSISRVADLGFDCMLGKHGGMLVDTVAGERVPLIRRDNLYVMKAWVRQDLNDVKPFGGPA